MKTNTSGLRCWCGHPGASDVIRTRRFAVLRCDDCRTFRIESPRVSDDSDSAQFYTEYYQGTPNPLPSSHSAGARPGARYWEVAARSAELTHPGTCVVDIGCGDGGLCGELLRQGWQQVTGVDVSESRIARARQRYPGVTFVSRPLVAADLPEEGADLIVMDNVIEHLPAPATLLRDIQPLLRARGLLVIITPNMESGHFRLLGRRWTPELAPHVHIFLFTAESIRRLLAVTGYELVRSGTFHLPMQAPRLTSPKHFLWSIVQEAGGLYGRAIGSGPMLYAVATPSRR